MLAFIFLLFVFTFAKTRGFDSSFMKTKPSLTQSKLVLYRNYRDKPTTRINVLKKDAPLKEIKLPNQLQYSTANPTTRAVERIKSLSYIFECLISLVNMMLKAIGLQPTYGLAIVIITMLGKIPIIYCTYCFSIIFFMLSS